jgi:hypothetical protein
MAQEYAHVKRLLAVHCIKELLAFAVFLPHALPCFLFRSYAF